MKRIIPYLIILTLVTSCSNQEKDEIDCSVIDCISVNTVELAFFENDQNLLEIEPNTAIEIIQHNESANFNIDTISNEVTLQLLGYDPITIRINEQELKMEISTIIIEGECCSTNKIDDIKIDNMSVCNIETCNKVIKVNIN